ncbi:alpha/beta-hydrolase family protein [Pseudoruegeria sp. SK021]|uniref:alpha/beta hydrolase n=1 Tax=Pseudoruegeria sp. SK021 TaxID=1933035 RepID=UPI000A2312D7|nr:alpha/beta-hydrolase family protein [Pseudoruegeria sp. SK021]OSP53609.1 hypothetical protein BV911_16980 [Pseudoruegeria sp. SK021]
MSFFRRLPSISVLSLLSGLLLAAASLTPSLIPRDMLFQGLLAGVAMAIGYLLMRFALALWCALEIPTLKGKPASVATFILAIPVFGVLVFCVLNARDWQNSIRLRMDLPALESTSTLTTLTVALVVFLVLFLIGILIQQLFFFLSRRLARYIPRRKANVLGLLLSALVVIVVTRDGVVNNALRTIDTSYAALQHLAQPQLAAPTQSWQSGSTQSMISWDLMGAPGREFVLNGPRKQDIEAFNQRPAKHPLRIYVGLAQDSDPMLRARLALDEMIRTGAFQRKILIVASPTGTGWMDPASYDALDYMHDGDVATVAAQYSYLQSPLALIFETQSGLEQATALMQVVYDYWVELPPEQRPRLYMHGLSLGAWSSMYAFNVFQMINDPIDGALWVGPPFPSALWNQANAARRASSPYVLPEIGAGQVIRYSSQFATPDRSGAPWGRMRVLFLQYASDPITFYSPATLWREPIWMREAPAPDVSPALFFTPIVTQLQLAVDMALSTLPPAGFGHTYHTRDYIDAWVAVTDPEGWTKDMTERLKQYCDQDGGLGCVGGR